MRTLLVAFGLALVSVATVAYADGSCSYQGTDYLNGSDACRAGVRYRCQDGLWQRLNVGCALQATLAETGCQFDGQAYASGRVTCREGTLYRCDGGRWQSLRTPCGQPAAAGYGGFVPLSVSQQSCPYGGAKFDAQSTMCRDGETYVCENGRWANLGAACR